MTPFAKFDAHVLDLVISHSCHSLIEQRMLLFSSACDTPFILPAAGAASSTAAGFNLLGKV